MKEYKKAYSGNVCDLQKEYGSEIQYAMAIISGYMESNGLSEIEIDSGFVSDDAHIEIYTTEDNSFKFKWRKIV